MAKTKTPKQLAGAVLRKWCKEYGIVLSANVAASLVSEIEQAIAEDRKKQSPSIECPVCNDDPYECVNTPSRHCPTISKLT